MRKTVKAFLFLAVCCIVVGVVWSIGVTLTHADEALSFNRKWELYWKPAGLMWVAVIFYYIGMRKLNDD